MNLIDLCSNVQYTRQQIKIHKHTCVLFVAELVKNTIVNGNECDELCVRTVKAAQTENTPHILVANSEGEFIK